MQLLTNKFRKMKKNRIYKNDYLIDDIITSGIAYTIESEKIKHNCKLLKINIPSIINYSNIVWEISKIERASVVTIILNSNSKIQYFVTDRFVPTELNKIPKELICPEIKDAILQAYNLISPNSN